MKKYLLSIAATLAMGCGVALGVPACPDGGTVVQPDGTEIVVYLHGDEFMNFLTTSDGYTIVKNSSGIYTYAERGEDGLLVAGHVAASNPGERDASARAYLLGMQKYLSPQPTEVQQSMILDRGKMGVEPGQRGLYDYKKFRGLVILAEYADCSFSRSDADSVFTNMVTQRDFKGIMSTSAIPTMIPYTGSVRDYFKDNSHGQFDPNFDVVGPVKLNLSQYYVNQTTNARALIKAVCTAADSLVNFADYDTDKDGTVDMFYVIFAGGGSNFSGNDSRLIWPHAWTMLSDKFDGVKLGRYACSTELYGKPATKKIDGIGTICHEFSHVLGLMDEYDTDYSTNGQSHDPGDWSLMAGGSYLNEAKTPCGYSLLQRYQSGFAVPQKLMEGGTYTLVDIDSTNSGYLLPLPFRSDEYWLLENRRKKNNKWNAYLPGEGMLVFRVDSTAPQMWSSNKINAYSQHNYYELVRAYNETSGSDLDSDPFPGARKVTSLTPTTKPALVAWNGDEPEYGITEIKEDSKGVITFKYGATVGTKTYTEDWEDIVTEGLYDTDVKGKTGVWSFSGASVDVMPSNVYMSEGGRALGMVKTSTATVKLQSGEVQRISFDIANTASRSAYYQVHYLDSVGNWINLYNTENVGNIPLSANGKASTTFLVPTQSNKDMTVRIKIAQGDASAKIWVDNFAVRFIDNGGSNVIDIKMNDVSNLGYRVEGENLVVFGEENAPVMLYSVTGLCVASTKISGGQALIASPTAGMYILVVGGESKKIKL